MPYVGLEHIEAQTMKCLGHSYARAVRSSSLRFSAGDVLYGRMRPYLNKVWVADFDGLCSAEFLVFRKSNWLNSKFLAFRLNSDDFVEFANARVSGERPRVDFEKLARFPILFPPADEQERIVTKLTAALSRVEGGSRAARRALERLQRYRQAVLEAAARGDLTLGWPKRRKGA
jgi:type I restriction enzyme S subunit